MFITCQECNTTFRLDENLLKPTGSKVRCSQCRHVFLAYPPAPEEVEPFQEATVVPTMMSDEAPSAAPEVQEEAQELEGIDLAELDSLLEGEALQDTGPQEDVQLDMEETSAGDELHELDDADLELDFDAALALDDEPKAAPVIAETDGNEEIDLDMDFSLDEDMAPSADETSASVAEIDEALALDENFEAAMTPSEAGESTPESDLQLDFDLEGDIEGAAPEAQATETVQATGSAGDDLDLENLDFDLGDLPPEKEMAGEEPELTLAEEDSEPFLDELEPALETPVTAAAEAGEDQDLDLDIDFGDALESEARQGAGRQEPELELALEPETPGEPSGDDLDLSDLDSLLGDDDGKPAKTDVSEDLELELDLDDATEPQAAAEAPVEEELEDLEFELDKEFTDTPEAAATAVSEADEAVEEEDEIDLSDIEQMLEGDQISDRKPKPAEAFESDLDLDLGDDSGEIDLTEIESAIDAAESTTAGNAADQEADDEELELDLDLDAKPQVEAISDDLGLDLSIEDDDTTKDDFDLDLDLELEGEGVSDKEQAVEVDDSELDLSDLSGLVEEPKKKSETINTGDIELEFEIEEEAEEPVSVERKTIQPEKRTEEISVEEALAVPLVAEEAETVEKPVKPAKPKKPKKKTNKSLVVLLILVLLGGIGYGAYYAVTQLGIEIPYLSEYIKPKPQDPAGTLNLSTLEINSKFIENGVSGRLFVITGKVRNGYSDNREKIRLQGKLFTKGKVLVKTEYSYAGIQLDDQELATLPVEQIKQRLTAVSQAQTAATVVRPGQNLPFMVVFSELPPAEQLDEFAIELLSSVQAQ